ncbi:hypothetical protein KGF56_001358 [Candida oxycetoniae]|uniref:FAD-binding FR-type domain-containing protein n=1 Tax=Candida oxycetoniae TaxID=497107 RepID=A0AAI9SYZ3_9ASCO|nr:uncharacterized protein KGF56_001358 [Candida oxycetoniae]KAI3405751.1 hypothetical protein KGF56_001358 [Candida oxycetoniae]
MLHASLRNLAYPRYEYMKFAYACNLLVNDNARYCESISPYNTNHTCLCNNPNWLASVMGCLSYGEKNTSKYLNGLIRYCMLNGKVELSPEQLAIAYQNYLSNTKTVTTTANTNTNTSKIIDHPVVLNSQDSKLYRDAYDKFLGNYDDSVYYGLGIYGYFTVIFIISSITNWTRYLKPRTIRKSTSPFVNFIRAKITVPALIGKCKTQAKSLGRVEFLIPSRLETLVLFGFLIVVVIMVFTNTNTIENDPVLGTETAARLRYVVDRCGIMSIMMMPLVFLFAGRNNILQWVTRWQYSRFVTIHRWTARVMFCLIIVHAFGYINLMGKFFMHELTKEYLQAGTLAAVAGGTMLIQGLLYLRRRFYELFLLLHIVLGMVWLGGIWIHVNELGYASFVYPVAAVWLLDRFIRLVRLFLFGFPLADVTLVSDETVKVIIPSPRYWVAAAPPTSYAFIHFIRPACFWQSHPFTFIDSVVENGFIHCYCQVKGGMTNGLYQYLADHPGKSAKIRVGVEGPYGISTPASHADSCIFICGGTGAPGVFNEAIRMSDVAAHSIKMVKFIWIVREIKSLQWFFEELRILSKTNIHATIYITRPHTSCNGSDCSGPVEKKIETKQSGEIYRDNVFYSTKTNNSNQLSSEIARKELNHIRFIEGRPTISKLVAFEVDQCLHSVAFVACGHPLMVDDVRSAVAQNVNNAGHKRVDYYEQLQVWS